MTQKNPLLSFREITSEISQCPIMNSTYNFVTGLWENETNPIIERVLNDEKMIGTTLITKTREGTDRSEGSY